MSRFIICRASAGSGKTYTLVRQFIEIAVSDPRDDQLATRFTHILAITFTNKAANGMKDRIMATLSDIVNGSSKNDPLVADMATHLDTDPDEVRRRCSLLLSAILHNYSDFSVCTIDSFVLRLVRTFAHDLGLPMNFNVQIDHQEILQSIVDELLSLAGNADEQSLTQLLCAFSESQMDDGKSYKIENSILKLSKEIFREEAPEYLSQLEQLQMPQFIAIHNHLLADIRRFEQSVTKAAAAFVSACSDAGLDADSFPYKGSSVYAFFRTIANGDYSKLNVPHKRVDDAYSEGRLHSKSAAADTVAAFQKVMPAFRSAYEAIGVDNGLRRYNTNRLLLSNLYGLGVLGKLNSIKNRYYSDNEIVHISEFNKRLDQEIADQPAPFVYERIGSRYHNYLIDEFQDTSRLQWLNFLPLLDEAMTYNFGPSTPETGTHSLVVGDAKQAIYRFRQGDVRQFVQLPQVDSRQHGLSLAREARVDRLVVNRRTQAHIVRFNNRFFQYVVQNSSNPILRQLYQGDGYADTQGVHQPDLYQETLNEGGYVHLSFMDRERLFASVLATIRHQVDDLHYSYGDIMVLARDNDTLVRIADYLTAHGGSRPVPIVSSESFILSNSQVVLLLQSALEYLHDPRNRSAALRLLNLAVRCGCLQPNVPPQSVNEASLYWMLADADYDLVQLLDQYGIAFNIDLLRALSLYDACEHLLRIFRLQGRDSAYVSTFLNVVASYTQRVRSDLASFNNYLAERIGKLSSATAGDLDAVQLMTVHKAKGLESKIVIFAIPYKREPNTKLWVHLPKNESTTLPVAFVNMQSQPTDFQSDFDQERLMQEVDNINVLYVALTRPEQKLFVLAEQTKNTGYASLLHQFAASDQQCQPSPEGDTYTIGTDAPSTSDAYRPSDAASKKQFPVDAVSFPQWENRVSIAAQNDALLSSLLTDNRRFGIVVHDLLSHIRTIDDLQPVVQGYCQQHHISDADADVIRQRISSMMLSDVNRIYFDSSYRVVCEASIVVDGEIRRPDRIIFAPDRTWVVDFKTGLRTDESHNKYQRQVEHYAAALSAMGYPHVQPVIIYL